MKGGGVVLLGRKHVNKCIDSSAMSVYKLSITLVTAEWALYNQNFGALLYTMLFPFMFWLPFSRLNLLSKDFFRRNGTQRVGLISSSFEQ